MSASNGQRAARDRVGTLPPDALRALAVFRETHAFAAQLAMPVWQLAESVASLHGQGIRDIALRLLCIAGLAECRLEKLTPSSSERTFRPITNLDLPDSACMILTAAGLDSAAERELAPVPAHTDGFVQAALAPPAPWAPVWDYKETLSWGNQVIKQLRRDADCQRLVLAAFQEAKWPNRIDDPLLRDGLTAAKERMRQTVRHLNKRHRLAIIEFWMDEERRGICWGRV